MREIKRITTILSLTKEAQSRPFLQLTQLPSYNVTTTGPPYDAPSLLLLFLLTGSATPLLTDIFILYRASVSFSSVWMTQATIPPDIGAAGGTECTGGSFSPWIHTCQ